MVIDSSGYVITVHTKAIKPRDSNYYSAQIIELNRGVLSVQSPERIIEHSCDVYGSSLKGRRKSAARILGTRSKLPISVNPEQAIHLFPTASTRNKHCVWLSYYHVHHFETRDNKSFVMFYDGTGLFVNASKEILNAQFTKTGQMIAQLLCPSHMGYASLVATSIPL